MHKSSSLTIYLYHLLQCNNEPRSCSHFFSSVVNAAAILEFIASHNITAISASLDSNRITPSLYMDPFHALDVWEYGVSDLIFLDQSVLCG